LWAFCLTFDTQELPVLIINGEKEIRMHEREMAAGLKHGLLEIVPNASHLAPIQFPDEYNARVIAWLQHVNLWA